jgi:DNA polymerase III alpha subunit
MTLADSMDAFDEVKQIATAFPDIKKAMLLEGQFRGMGVHPAGFVVASTPLDDVVPIYEQPEKGRVVGLDMYDAADAGLLKIDLLGLSTMTQIARARDAVRQFHDVDIPFYSLPLDDKETMRGFAEADVLGIFQFGGKATKNTLRQIKPTKFSELADINTLSRPGAMLAGTSDQYVAIHNGRAKPESIHPIVDGLTQTTHNLVLYQEQVLAIMREFGGLTWAQASEIRKDISKRVGMEKLQRFREDFVNGAAKQGIDEKTAIDVWMKTSTFGAYGFNLSHSVSYSIIAYWQMYVKRHYPKEFYYAALATENDVDLRNLFILEARRKGVDFLPVDPNLSGKNFTLETGGIRYGLTQIKGIGDKTAELIIEARPITSREDLTAIRGIGEKTADMFESALAKKDDLFDLREEAESIRKVREDVGAIGVAKLRAVAEDYIDTSAEYMVAGHIISRNYRQEQKLATQAKSPDKVGAKSDTVIIYIRDESGESFPCVIPGSLANRKTREIWEGGKHDVYALRGRLPNHGKFFLVNGLANTNWQEEKRIEATATQLSIPF